MWGTYDVTIFIFTLSWLLVASFFALTLHMYYVFLFYLINLKFQVAKSELNPFDKIKGKLLANIYYAATKIMNNKTMSSTLFTVDQYIYELIGIQRKRTHWKNNQILSTGTFLPFCDKEHIFIYFNYSFPLYFHRSILR